MLFVLTVVFLFPCIFTLQLAKVTPTALEYFREEYFGSQILAGAQLLFALSFVIRVLVLTAVALGPWAAVFARRVLQAARGHRVLAVLLYLVALWSLLQLISLPLSFYRGYVLEHRWGLSTQSLAGWWTDYVKSATLDLGLSAVGVCCFCGASGGPAVGGYRPVYVAG